MSEHLILKTQGNLHKPKALAFNEQPGEDGVRSRWTLIQLLWTCASMTSDESIAATSVAIGNAVTTTGWNTQETPTTSIILSPKSVLARQVMPFVFWNMCA